MDYDIIVVGGGPMGLSAAYQCAVKRGLKVLVLERYSIGNQYGSSPGISRQFRICYSEENLCKLAIDTSELWDELMDDLGDHTILRKTGTLWFGDSGVTTSEGNIEQARKNLEKYNVPFHTYNDKEDIERTFPFIAGALNNIDNPQAIFVKNGGTINVKRLVERYQDALGKSDCLISEYVHLKSIDYNHPGVVHVTTMVTGGLTYEVRYRAKKVILTPGAYVNSVLSTLIPAYPERINYRIYLWSTTYFKIKKSLKFGNPEEWPTWYFFGQKKELSDSDKPVDGNAYYGFPGGVESGYARVAPAFTSEKKFKYRSFPPQISEREVDSASLDFTCDFVEKSMHDLSSERVPDKDSTCIAGFAEKVETSDKNEEDKQDNSAGFVLDYVPKTNDRIVLTTGGWGMKYVPLMGVLLAELAVDGGVSDKYKKNIEPMNIDRGILISVPADEK